MQALRLRKSPMKYNAPYRFCKVPNCEKIALDDGLCVDHAYRKKGVTSGLAQKNVSRLQIRQSSGIVH